MATVLIRGVDDTIVERLRERAKHHGRSLEAELRIALRGLVDNSSSTIGMEEIREQLRQARESFAGRTFSDSAALIREDRDSR